MERRTSLDYAKGLAILLLIVSHCVPGEGILKTWIFSFHMPVFFVICGVLHEMRCQNGECAPNLLTFIIKRTKQLLIPYFVFGIVLIGFYQMLHMLAGQALDLKSQLIQLITLQGIESMWFIPCYFVTELLYLYFIQRLHPRTRLIMNLGIVTAISYLAWVGMPENSFLRWIIKILIGVVFVYAGATVQKYQLIKPQFICWAIVGGIVCGVAGQLNGFVGMGALQLQNGILFFIIGTCASVCILILCESLNVNISIKFKLLREFGQNTIVVVCTNNLMIECLRLLDYKFTGNFLLCSGCLGQIILIGLVAIIEYTMILSSYGALAPVYGKKRINRK